MAIGEEKSGVLASQCSTGTTGGDGVRVGADSEWSHFECPSNFAINKGKTQVATLVEMGSEHDYSLEYYNDVEILPGVGIMQPQGIRVKTNCRSSEGPWAGKGAESISVTFYYVQFKA